MDQISQLKRRLKLAGDDEPAYLGGAPSFDQTLSFNQPTLSSFASIRPAIEKIIDSGQLTNGQNVKDFEAKATDYFGRPTVAVASCTSGLILMAKILGLAGHVIVPSFTFFATTHALLWNNLKPRFVDIDPDSWTIDPEAVEKGIDSSVSAILAVDIGGNPSEKDALEEISKRHGIKLITDAAHAFGSVYKDKLVGGFGDAEVFSLSPTKLVVAGEGGLVTLSDPEVAEELKVARDYGNSGDYNCQFVGLNARMTEINAVIGMANMEQVSESVARRNEIAEAYRINLKHLPGLTWQTVAADNICAYKDISVLIEAVEFGMDRDLLGEALEAEGIGTRKYYSPPAHKQKAYGDKISIADKLINTERVSQNVLSLPVFSHMKNEDIDRVCQAVIKIYKYRDEISDRAERTFGG